MSLRNQRQQAAYAKLTRRIWLHRLRTLGLVSLVVVPILAILVWLTFDPIASRTEVTGTLVGLRQPQSEVPGPPILSVELDSGKTVFVSKPVTVLYREGARVRLLEMTTYFLSRKRYAFESYLEQE